MSKSLIIFALIVGCTNLLALTPITTQERIPSLSAKIQDIQYPNTTTQPVNCFDYYRFGSVYASLETKNSTNISGTKINFFGEIKNDNTYPIVNGKLFVKIMRQNDAYGKTGGQDEVDSYIVKDNISIKANSSIPISFDWKIPAYAPSGEYQASTYFLIDNIFNMSGLSFTTDIVGGVVKFAVTGEQKTTVFFDRTKIKLNNNPYYTVAFTPSVKEDEPTNIIFTLTNTTKEIQRVPVTLDLYVWDAQNQKNLLRQEQTTFLLNPNLSIEVPYTVTDLNHSVYFLQAKAQYRDTKSEVSVRFSRQNKQEPRINFITLTTYPLEEGKENNLITCVHNKNNNDADYGKVITTIYNYKGKQIHQSQYEGKITSAIQGVNSKFTPQANYRDLTIETKIYDKAGMILDESKLTYVCSEFSDNCTEPQIVFDTKTFLNSKSLLILLGILLLLIILIFIKKHFKNKNIITSLLFLCTMGVVMMPEEARAGDEIDWSYTYPGGLGTTWSINYAQDNSWEQLPPSGAIFFNPNFTIDYHASVFDHESGLKINKNSEILPGQVLDFVFGPFHWKDIFWSSTGGTWGTPYGDWVTNAEMTMDNQYQDAMAGFYIDVNYAGPTWSSYYSKLQNFLPKFVFYGPYLTWSGNGYGNTTTYTMDDGTINDDYFNSRNIFAQFSVNPPDTNIEVKADEMFCGTPQKITENGSYSYKISCTVLAATSDKTISPKFIFGKTYGSLYAVYEDAILGETDHVCLQSGPNYWGYTTCQIARYTNFKLCPENSSSKAGLTGQNYCNTYNYEDPSQRQFIADIPVSTIEFPLNLVRCPSSNTPPTAPSLTFTPATVTVGQETSIAFSSTDTQNNPINYQIDWGDGTITTETSPTLKSWTTAGTKTIKIRAKDTCGESAWVTKTITVNAVPVLDPLTVTTDPTCGSVVLNWNNNTATSYQVFRKEGTGPYITVSPILTTTTFSDTTIIDRHTYTYRIWSNKETISRLSNEVVVMPTCSLPIDFCNNIEDIQTAIPNGLQRNTAGHCVCGG